MRLSQIGRTAGMLVDTIELDLASPYPRDSARDVTWLIDQFAERIVFDCTFIMIASKDSTESPWLLWEAFEAFSKAKRVLICWVSGNDPYKVVFPLEPSYQYRIMRAPLSFLIDCRSGPSIAENVVAHILAPDLRYRVVLRFTQIAVVLVTLALLLFPVTVLLIAQLLPPHMGIRLTSALLRPWVAWASLSLATIFAQIFYPSYQGPLRFARKPTDRFVRVITRGDGGRQWNKLIYAFTFVGACWINGVHLLSLKSASGVPLVVFIEAGIVGFLLEYAWDRGRFNLFTHHLGAFNQKFEKYYGVKLLGKDARV